MSLLELPVGDFYKNPTDQQTTILQDFLGSNRTAQNVRIVGKGMGITNVYGFIRLDGWFPTVENLSLFPDPLNPEWVLLDIRNPGRVSLANLELNPPAGSLGVSIMINDDGVQETSPGWPLTNEPTSGARISVSMLQNIYCYGDGRGLLFQDLTTVSEAEMPGQFVNHIRLIGGHCNVGERAIEFAPRVGGSFKHNLIMGYHIDVAGDGLGLAVGPGAEVTWVYPGYIEPTWQMVQSGGGNLVSVHPEGKLVFLGDYPKALVV